VLHKRVPIRRNADHINYHLRVECCVVSPLDRCPHEITLEVASPISVAQVVMDLLKEMNPDVKGEYRVAGADLLVKTEPDYFAHFSLIIATQVRRHPVTLKPYVMFHGSAYACLYASDDDGSLKA
jgi:hypothetical protein